MIILLPTYNRLEPLPLVIASILGSDIEFVEERVLVVVANNFPPASPEVDRILDNSDFQYPFQYMVVHSQVTVPAVENWFSIIQDVANNGEIVTILGDDDILLPTAIRDLLAYYRYYPEIDMLVSNYISRLFFSCQCSKFALISNSGINKLPIYPSIQFFVPTKDRALLASFISSHSYRYSKLIRSSYELAITWCRSQDWAHWTFASGLLPTWMAYAVLRNGGSVYYNDNYVVLRGQLLSELSKLEYADGGSTAYYNLLYCNMFSGDLLSCDIYNLRENYRLALEYVRSSWVGFLLNTNIPFRVKTEAVHRANLSWRMIILSRTSMLSIVPQLLKSLPYVKGLRARFEVWINGKDIKDLATFLQAFSMGSLNPGLKIEE